MSGEAFFSPDYAAARLRFRTAVERLGWRLECHPIAARGPDGSELTVDAGLSPGGDPARVLVISSGLHGVEGFFGSAVQLAVLARWATAGPPRPRCVVLHALNPFGFAWLRRCDENNVDPNRNFLLPGERYQGVPDGYARMEEFLNPPRPPALFEAFTLRALYLIARHGMPALRQAVAEGQYDYPRGLFYGGQGPSQAHRILDENLPRWLRDSRSVVHLDFHTGLGRAATCKLLIDTPPSAGQSAWLARWFGAEAFEACHATGIAYESRGGLGQWCVGRGLAPEYLFACAEFGTYDPVQVLAGLRAENQAHHWGDAAAQARARRRLRELFCPAAADRREPVIERSLELADRAAEGLAAAPDGASLWGDA